MSYNNNAISSDDPKAVEKLTEKLNKCEKEQEFMKKVNAYYKKNGTVKGCEGVSDELAAKLDKKRADDSAAVLEKDKHILEKF